MSDAAPEAPEQEDSKALEAVKAEALAVRHEDGSTTVPLITDGGTVDITIPPPTMWFEGAVEALTRGQISAWVKLAVDDPEAIVAWDSLRKRYRDLDGFLERWSKATGESPGESSGSSAS